MIRKLKFIYLVAFSEYVNFTILTAIVRNWIVGKSQIFNEGTTSKVKRVQESNFYSFALWNCDSKEAIQIRLVVSRAWIFYGSGSGF